MNFALWNVLVIYRPTASAHILLCCNCTETDIVSTVTISFTITTNVCLHVFLWFPDEPNRERTYESKATIFLRHGKQMADTAKSVAEAGSCPDKKVVGELNATANEVRYKITIIIIIKIKIRKNHNFISKPNMDDIKIQFKNENVFTDYRSRLR